MDRWVRAPLYCAAMSVNPGRNLIGVWGVAAAVLAVAACGDTITLLECPPGTEPRGAECVPWGAPDVVDEPDGPIEDVGGLLDLPLAKDVADADPDPGPADGAADSTTPKDTAPEVDVAPTLGGVGDACAKGSDCLDGTCLEWAGGYCTRLDCKESGCPAGSLCMPLEGGNTGCMTLCQSDAQCRPGGEQACKTVPGQDGAGKSVCHGLADGAGAIGATCASPADCLGPATCLSLMPGGYCGVQPCDATSCPLGSACVKYQHKPTCMQTCASDLECESSPDQERACGSLPDTANVPTDVCLSATKTKAVGAFCQTNVECQTGLCQILGEGRCSQANTPCFGDLNCPGLQSCLISLENRVGICSQQCSLSLKCPGNSFCVGEPGLPSGWCRPSCEGLGDTACRQQDGFECTWGLALGDTTGGGRYLCATQPKGGIGQSCESADDCATGECAIGSGTSTGMCRGPCSDYYCPFPGSCVADASGGTCYKACVGPEDCGPGFSCQPMSGAVGQVCQ